MADISSPRSVCGYHPNSWTHPWYITCHLDILRRYLSKSLWTGVHGIRIASKAQGNGLKEHAHQRLTGSGGRHCAFSLAFSAFRVRSCSKLSSFNPQNFFLRFSVHNDMWGTASPNTANVRLHFWVGAVEVSALTWTRHLAAVMDWYIWQRDFWNESLITSLSQSSYALCLIAGLCSSDATGALYALEGLGISYFALSTRERH